MGKIMRNAILTAGAIVLCVGGTAQAGTSPVLKANVPFAFAVNGRNFAPGRYTVERDDLSPSVLLIRGQGHNHAATFIAAIPDGGSEPLRSKPVLVFEKHENEYQLSSVWDSPDQGWDVIGK